MPTSQAASFLSISTPVPIGRDRDRFGGYVLMELLVAMAILAMIAALALPSGSIARSPSALRAKALDVAILMRGARNEALRSGHPTGIQIDPAARRILSAQGSVLLPIDIAVRFEGLDEGGIEFGADGRATAGRIVLSTYRSVTTISVDPMTAAIFIGPPL